ncbi:MAG TPA: hypothetical protein VKX16_12595 [Chloroflexota bacterium]|nr:hypothetical protein [Chloroflexota bacterium]
MGAFRVFRAKQDVDESLERLEARREAHSRAKEQWLSVLRDMERDGQTGEARYESYYRAYMTAKQQEKRAELELFNLRQGLSS